MTLKSLIALFLLNTLKSEENKMNFEFTNESCFDLLSRIPSNSVDLILIDPPYEISRPTNFQSGEETGRDTDRFRISIDF